MSLREFIGNPEFHLGCYSAKSEGLEIGRQYSDDRKVAHTGGYDFPEHTRVCAVAPEPELVAEHNNFAVAEYTVRGRDQSSQKRLCSESFQVTVLNPEANQALGLLFVGA